MDKMILVAMQRAVEWDVPFTLLPRDASDILTEIERLRWALVKIRDGKFYHVFKEGEEWATTRPVVELMQETAQEALQGSLADEG